LDLLILKSLIAGEMHGLGVSRRNSADHRRTFVVKPGSSFPLCTAWKRKVGFPPFGEIPRTTVRAKYYRLTKPGRKQLEAETKRWGRISWAIAQALEASLTSLKYAAVCEFQGLLRNLFLFSSRRRGLDQEVHAHSNC